MKGMTTRPDNPAEGLCQERIDAFTDDSQRLRRRQRYVELGRLLVALVLLAPISGLWSDPKQGFWWGLLGVGAGIFVALVIWHRRLAAQLQHCLTLVTLNQESLARVRRDFSVLLPCPANLADSFSEQDRDLNLYGHASLGQLLFNLSTSLGDKRLAEWLSRGSPMLEQHQQAVRELAPQLDLRQRLYAYARDQQNMAGHRLEPFRAWATDTSEPLVTPIKQRVGWLLNVIFIICLLLVVSKLVAVWILALPLLLNLVFLGFNAQRFRHCFEQADLQSEALNSLSRIVELIGSDEFQSQPLQQIRESLLQSPQRPGAALRQLSAIVHHSRLRFNPVPYMFLQLCLLWDFHVACKLQQWRSQFAVHVADWLEAISHFEAISALANLSFENPTWGFPVCSKEPGMSARQAVHPLPPPGIAVANDIVLAPAQVTIITGSNMSGKTTYMRTLGLNLKLAMAGGPVACAEMRFPPCELYTAISSRDSLEQGISYFMSEVVQIKHVLEGVEQSHLQPVFLLDELLKGTNERERNLAIVALLKKLCTQRAMGLMTTHNVALATHPELQSLCKTIYFEEDLDEQLPEKVVFNYRLKEGVSTQTNALKLLRILGVELDD